MDEVGVERAYALHGARVLRYCAFRLASWAEAEDAAAETFIRLFVARHRVDDRRVEAWLIAVASRICTDIQRQQRRTARHGELPEVALLDDPAPAVWSSSSVRDAVRRLSVMQRRVLFFRTIEDLPFSEVAKRCRRSEPAVRMTWHRAIKRLRALLEES